MWYRMWEKSKLGVPYRDLHRKVVNILASRSNAQNAKSSGKIDNLSIPISVVGINFCNIACEE